jgi:hypothetical protein
MLRPILLLLFLAVVAAVLLPAPGHGCMAVPPKGYKLRIAEESAVIVWDALSKTQHFIRRATFETAAPNFGFLVPTPSKPELAEVKDAVFGFLEELIKPRIVQVSGGFEFTSLLLPGSSADATLATRSGDKAAAPAVRVLATVRVAGYDAAVLEADNTQALNDWLAKHGYPSSPELVSWLSPYVAANWKITAFKIAPDAAKEGQVRSSAVRMSFQTERPFFPYREPQPADAKQVDDGPRLLRVFFIGEARTTGKRGNLPWPARVAWADRLDAAQLGTLARDLDVPPEQLRSGAWLTTFEDPASPRPGTDEVFFESAAEQSVVRPPDIIQRLPPVKVPAELALLVFGLVVTAGIVGLRRWRPKAG